MNLLKKSLIAPTLALFLSTNIYAGETYTLESMPLKQAIKQITSDLKLPYIVDSKLLEDKKSIKINNIKGVKKALIEILDKANLEAQFKDDLIIIKKKVKKSINKQSSQTSLGELTIIGNEESAFGKLDGYTATKSSTGSKMDLDISEIPQSISVITRDFMDIRNTQSIQSALSYSSAISQPYGEYGDIRYNWGSSRGSGVLYANTFLDGLKMGYNIFAIPRNHMYTLERAEILKGPSSVLYGASSPGGILNLQSKRANDSRDKEIELIAGSNNLKSIGIDVNNVLSEDVFLRLVGKYKENGDRPSALKKNELHLLQPALKYKVSDNTTLDLIALYSRDDMPGAQANRAGGYKFTLPSQIAKNSAFLSGLLNSFGFPISANAINAEAQRAQNVGLAENFYIGHESDTSNRDTKSFATLFNHKFNDKTQVNSSFRYYKLDGKYKYALLDANRLVSYVGSLNYTTLPIVQKNFSFDLESISIDNNIEHKWDNKYIQNTSMLGLDYYYHNSNEKEHDALPYSFDVLNPNYKQTIGSSNSIVKNTDNKLKQLGIYVQNQAKIYEKIIVSTALRYDNVKDDNSDNIANTSSSQDDTNVSGRIGLAYAFDNGLTPYISYATSFTTNPGSGKSGKKFKPSVGKQIEFGAKYKLDEYDGYLTTAIYKIEEEDILTTDPSDTNFSLQEADSEIKGFELDLALKPIENMNLVLSYTKLDTKRINKLNPNVDGLELEIVPKSTFSLWSDYTIPNTNIGDFRFGGGVKYVGESIQTFYDPINEMQGNPDKIIKINAYSTVEAMIGSTYDNMDFNFTVANLFDERTELSSDLSTTSYNQGRTYNFRFKYKF